MPPPFFCTQHNRRSIRFLEGGIKIFINFPSKNSRNFWTAAAENSKKENLKKGLTQSLRYGNIYLALRNSAFHLCASGGIGRLAGFRCQCSQGRAGSTPASRTKTKGTTKVVPFVLGSAGRWPAPPFGDFNPRVGKARPPEILRCAPNLRRTRGAAQKGRWEVFLLAAPKLKISILTARSKTKGHPKGCPFVVDLVAPKAGTAAGVTGPGRRPSRPPSGPRRPGRRPGPGPRRPS